MPDYMLLLAVNDPGILLDGWQKWAAAGRDTDKLYTAYRHHNLYLPSGDWESLKAQWRAMFFRFVNRTWLERYAPIVKLVLENNEYFTDQSIVEEGIAKYLNSARAGVTVWNGEFRGRVVTSPDGGSGTIRADCRLVIGNCFVAHNIPREYMQLAIAEDAVIGYHNYSLWNFGQRNPGDWRDHSGRWNRNEQEYGLRPRYAFTEGGPYDGTAPGGWKAGTCMGGNAGVLVSGMGQVYDDMTRTAAYREGRLFGPGALFTIGGDVTGWPLYELKRDELVALGQMLTRLWQPGEYSDMDRAKIEYHIRQALAETTGHWWDGWSEGALDPLAHRAKSLDASLPLYRTAGAATPFETRTVNPETYVLNCHERQGEWLRVTSGATVIWCKGSDCRPA